MLSWGVVANGANCGVGQGLRLITRCDCSSCVAARASLIVAGCFWQTLNESCGSLIWLRKRSTASLSRACASRLGMLCPLKFLHRLQMLPSLLRKLTASLEFSCIETAFAFGFESAEKSHFRIAVVCMRFFGEPFVCEFGASDGAYG